jgi:hypothetical protein
MTDRYANIRRALEMGPTPGPWKKVKDKWGVRVDAEKNPHGDAFDFGIAADILGDRRGHDATGGTPDANAAHIAACDPDTIRELLAERDALAQENEALRRCAIKYLGWLGVTHMPLDQALREDMSDPTMCGDAAIAAATEAGMGEKAATR